MIDLLPLLLVTAIVAALQVELGLNWMNPTKLMVKPDGRVFIEPSRAALPGSVLPTQFEDPELLFPFSIQ